MNNASRRDQKHSGVQQSVGHSKGLDCEIEDRSGRNKESERKYQRNEISESSRTIVKCSNIRLRVPEEKTAVHHEKI